MGRCFCCFLLGFPKDEDNSLLLRQPSTSSLVKLFSLYDVEASITNSQHGGRKNKVEQSTEIKIIWANNPDTNAVFTKLGAVDIVLRYDKLLNQWKLLKDTEQEFKSLMGMEQNKELVKCLDSIPPEMRVGFSHGSSDSEYEFHLDIDPMVSMEKLNVPLMVRLKRSLHLFSLISSQMNTIRKLGCPIVKDLGRLAELFRNQDEPFIEIKGVRHSVDLLNRQQVEQAYLIIKDIVSLTGERSHALMDYILRQGDKVDMKVINHDPDNPKVIIFSKKLGSSKRKRSSFQ
ncbi:uncharacterized protein LOC5511891 isoform X1 [Nematostella vectensis]|uniref:uncharacterized protein LOC5511891 isoform X1 n=1 Tax=Nematostella vectensis TaxID=45351 RepID=UPI00138FA85E|nr:uncharacterized protein LOC5511891 isoform X1 [Nematostella vectensis]